MQTKIIVLLVSLTITRQVYTQTNTYFQLTDSVFEVEQVYIDDRFWFRFSPGILFEESIPYLDSIAAFLHYHNHLSFDLSYHSDNRGSEEYNMKLSERRITLLSDSLIQRLIEKGRITPKPKGENTPRLLEKDKTGLASGYLFPKNTLLDASYINSLNDHTNKEQLKFEDAHALNRRVEIQINSTNFVTTCKPAHLNVFHGITGDTLVMIPLTSFQLLKIDLIVPPLIFPDKTKGVIITNFERSYCLFKHTLTQQLFVAYELSGETTTLFGFFPVSSTNNSLKIPWE